MDNLKRSCLSRSAFFCLLLLVLYVPEITTTELYKEPDGLVRLFETADDFKAAVTECDDRVWLINFFADDCSNCILLATKVPEIAKKLDGFVEVGAVNCSHVPEVCGATGIERLPSLKVFDWNVKENPYTGVPYKEPPKEVLVEGEVDIDALVKKIKGFVPDSFIHTIPRGSPDRERLFEESKTPKVLFLSNKKKRSDLLKSLSLLFRERLKFFFGFLGDEKLLAKLPAGEEDEDPLYVIKPGGEILIHDGPLQKGPVTEFLSAHAIERPPKAARKTSASDDITPEETTPKNGHVFPLNATGFEQEVLSGEPVWVVAFFREPCERKYEEWLEASLPLTGQVRLGEFNLSAHPEGEKIWETAAPGVVFTAEECLRIVGFPFGEDKEGSKAELYEGPLEGKALSKFGLATVPDIVTPLESNEALEEFLAQEQWRPKMLLFTAKKETPDMWRALAARFRNTISFALIHEDDTELLERLKVTKVPKVLTIFAKPDEGPGMSLSIQPFPKALKYSNLATWCLQISAVVNQAREKGGGGALSVRELKSDDDFQRHCVERGICIVALLDGSQKDSASQVDSLKQVAQINSLGPVSYVWADVTSASGFASQLGLSKPDAPTILLLNAKKMRYARLEGEFNARTLEGFVDGVVSGKIPVSRLEALPKFGATPADEADAPTEEVEEEFNLEDIMKEEVEASAVKSRQEKLAELEKQREEEAAALRLEQEQTAKAEKGSSSSKKKRKKKKASGEQDRLEL